MPEFWLQGEKRSASSSRAERGCEEMLDLNGYTGWVREYRFAPPRRWRFDFAFLDQQVALEVEGLTGGPGGRHQRIEGFVKDAEKYAHALLLGWHVMRVPASWIVKGDRRIWHPLIFEVLDKFGIGKE